MSNEENNFLDSKTIIAIVLVGLVWFGWQSYLSKKYPAMQKSESQKELTVKTEEKEITKGAQEAVKNQMPPVKLEAVKENILNVNSEEASFAFTSRGLGVKDISLNKFSQRDKSKIQLVTGTQDPTFEMFLLNSPAPLVFAISKIGDNSYEGTATAGHTKIIRKIEYIPKTYALKNKIIILNPDKAFKGFLIALSEKKEAKIATGFLVPRYEHQEFVVNHSVDKYDRINVSIAKEKIEKDFSNVAMAAISSQYFATALLDKSEIIPSVTLHAGPEEKELRADLIYNTLNPKEKMEFSFTAFMGPKAKTILESADPGFVGLINFGFFGVIGKVLLFILEKLYAVVGNWGGAIILLTIFVRALVLPFNITSYKSMKKMQNIQPLLKSLRERYKDDPQALNRETMALMKQEKVNPLGGCLPMFLQMPVFFAFYQVLGQSIELYQAPFFGWITDLSLKDPYYVLPVLMGLTMWLQQKTTPSTMDPAQAKVMQFMPIIFSFMMVSLPSGLTLYTFISTLFGVLQQQYFTRDRRALSKA